MREESITTASPKFPQFTHWSLFSLLTVFLLGATLGYVVWWTRDIRLSISLHVFANTLIRLIFLAAAWTM
ncbi:MAG: hypothetical protein R3293_09415 [Candidatus Promineifilaceae bacterium]|nr:hypothetical protein [Candidatus Promineifilaceae bacterium]